MALAESWCNRLLSASTADLPESSPSADMPNSTLPTTTGAAADCDSVAATVASSAAISTVPASLNTKHRDTAADDAARAEEEVIGAAIAAGEDISHFRALLRRARNKADAVAASMKDDPARLPSSSLGVARTAAELQVEFLTLGPITEMIGHATRPTALHYAFRTHTSMLALTCGLQCDCLLHVQQQFVFAACC
jgi:hypothetical protein